MLPFCCHGTIPWRKNSAFSRVFGLSGIIPTPQITLRIKQFCLGDLSCGISIIHFVLYCTWLLMLRYHFVSTFDNELCNLWRQCVPGGLLLIWYYSADWGGCQGVSFHFSRAKKTTDIIIESSKSITNKMHSFLQLLSFFILSLDFTSP